MKVDFNPNRVRICYYNDLHGNSDYVAGMAYGIAQFKNQPKDCVSFVLSGGDNCSGADVKKNGFIFRLMQILGVDASAVGNHETDALSEGFIEANNDKIDFIATNVTFSPNNPMSNSVKKSLIKEQEGVKVGFIGAMPIDFNTCTKDKVQTEIHVMDYQNTILALQSEINKLQEQKINKIILISHLGYETDKRIAKELSGVDVIIGGHSHTVVPNAKIGENVITSKTKEPILITQGGENADYYGIADLTFDENGVITKLSNQLYENQIKHKNLLIEALKEQYLGKSPIVGKISHIADPPKDIRNSPCAWTNMLADSMKAEMNTDIAIINSTNIRKIPKAGILTERDITESAPMKNDLIKTKVTQKQLIEAVRNKAKSTMTTGSPGLLIGSGFTYKITSTGDLIELKINGQSVNLNNPENKIYTACYDSFVARKEGENPELYPQFETKYFDYDKDYTMMNYIRKRKDKDDLNIQDDGRIQIVKFLDMTKKVLVTL